MHSLRKGFGCRYASHVPAQVLQKLMRHANIKTTMDYYANVDAAVEAAVLGANPAGGSGILNPAGEGYRPPTAPIGNAPESGPAGLPLRKRGLGYAEKGIGVAGNDRGGNASTQGDSRGGNASTASVSTLSESGNTPDACSTPSACTTPPGNLNKRTGVMGSQCADASNRTQASAKASGTPRKGEWPPEGIRTPWRSTEPL
jgi:hypothetical protein